MSLLFNTYGIVQLHLNRRRCSGSLVEGMPAWHGARPTELPGPLCWIRIKISMFSIAHLPHVLSLSPTDAVRAIQRDVMHIWIWHVRVLRCPSVEALHHPMRTPAYVERLTKLRTVPDTHLYLTVFVKQGEKNWNINVVKLPKEKVNSFINSALLIVSLSREEFLSSQN